MELRQLEHFVAVAEERHFTNAADRLRLSQSGLSASIRALEDHLATPLFVRTTRQVELTAAGRALLPEARRAIASIESARAAVDAVTGLLAGALAVGSEPCPGVLHLAAELARFRGCHPGVDLRLMVGGSRSLVEEVAGGQLDLAIVVPTDPLPRGVVLTPIGSEELVVLSHPNRPVSRGRSVALGDLVSQSFVDFAEGASSRTLTRRALARSGHDYCVSMEVNDVHTLLDLVGEDLGIAVVPRSIASKRPELLATPVEGAEDDWQVCVAVSPTTNPAAGAFRDQLIAVAGRD